MLHVPDTLHTGPYILQHAFGFLYQRKVTHISEYKPNYSDKNYHRHVNPYRIKHGLEPFEQSRVQYDKISFTKLLGTLLIDRVSDTIMVGLITLMIFIYKPNYSDKNYHRHVNPYRIKHGLEPFEQSRVLGEETRKEAYIKYEYHQGYQTDHDRIAHTVDQQGT